MMGFVDFIKAAWHAAPLTEHQRDVVRRVLFQRFPERFRSTRSFSMWQSRVGSVKTLRPLPTGRKCLILTTGHTLYIAKLLSAGLRRFGFDPEIASRWDGSATDYCIAIAPHMFDRLPEFYFAFQVEQLSDPRWDTGRYNNVLRQASAVFDFSRDNIRTLLARGFHYTGLFYVPISMSNPDPGHGDKPIDVLFYGVVNQRRRALIEALSEHVRIKVVEEVYGDAMQELLRSAKVVVNIHHHGEARLESTRIYESLSAGAMIVSEDSPDTADYPDLAEFVSFVPTGDVAALRDALRAAIARASDPEAKHLHARALRAIPRTFDHYLGRFCLAYRMISYETFSERVSDYAGLPKEFEKVCLTLSETPDRRAGFAARHPTVSIYEGLRFFPAWKGCALSYKFLFQSERARTARTMLVCEDDALFSEDNGRLDAILSYLAQNDGQWDVFSGFIADLADDTEILRVEENAGMKFVWLTRSSSTTFNIYAPRAMQKLADWQDTDDVRATIDRFMSASGLTFVTTVPFFADHDERSTSTLWGFDNSQYTQMSIDSTHLLNKKIAAFEAARRENAG